MTMTPERHQQRLEAHLRELNALPGIRVTRRGALKWASLGALAANLGCDAGAGSATAGGVDARAQRPAADTFEPTAQDNGSSGGQRADTQRREALDAGSPDATEAPVRPDVSPLSLPELMALIHPEALALVESEQPELAEMPFLNFISEVLPRLVTELPGLGTPSWDIETLLSQPPVEIVTLEFAPGAVIPLHDHRDYIGAIMGVEGEVECVNYTRVDGYSEPGTFLLQQSGQKMLTAGVTGALGSEWNNFHVLTAGAETARLVDVFTFYPGGAGYSAWAEVESEPTDPANGIYQATWL